MRIVYCIKHFNHFFLFVMFRIVDPDQPVLWLDTMPDKSVKAGFNVHMTLVK